MVADVEQKLLEIRSFLHSMALTPNSRTSLAHESQLYEVEEVKVSESAWVLFTRHSGTGREVVMKILSNYKDSRFDLERRSVRQRCQLEAIKRNRSFTRGVYLGLARAYDVSVDKRRIIVGKTIEKPGERELNEVDEYALLMRKLPEDRCLVRLLEEDMMNIKDYVRRVIKNLVLLHRRLTLVSEEEIGWGSPEQLKNKLEENIWFVNPVLSEHGEEISSSYSLLREALRETVANSAYWRYFEQRRDERCIKSCHGDLKSPNIWITKYSDALQRTRLMIKLLDAIDFNPIFSNIDVLSDFAMLVVDVQARTRSPELATFMIDTYLELTGQRNEDVQAVLTYYLMEKAMISAAISIKHDGAYSLGKEFLEVGKRCMEDLTKFVKN